MDGGMWGGRAGGAGRDDSSLLAFRLPSCSQRSPQLSRSRLQQVQEGWFPAPGCLGPQPHQQPPAPLPAPQPVVMADVCAFLRGLSLLPAAGSSRGCLSRARGSSEQSRQSRGPCRVLGRLGGGRSCAVTCPGLGGDSRIWGHQVTQRGWTRSCQGKGSAAPAPHKALPC